MSNTKISQLSNVGNVDGSGLFLPVVDTTDTTQAASGTTKKADLEIVVNASGYEFTGGFADKTEISSGVFGHSGNSGVNYTQADVDAGFSAVHEIDANQALEWAKKDVELTREHIKPFWSSA